MLEGSGADIVVDRRPRDGAPLLLDSSIKDFQKGKAGYVDDTLEQPLLLPQDMVDLRILKKHEVFLTLKRDLAMVNNLVH